MFDKLVDTTKKRNHVFFLIVSLLILLSVLWDIIFLVKVASVSGFEKLDYYLLENTFSGFSFYAYLLFGAKFMYSSFSPLSIVYWIIFSLRSLTIIEYLLVFFLYGYQLSHRSSLSKVALLELRIYYVIRLVGFILLPLAIHNACLKSLSAQFVLRYRIVSIVLLFMLIPYFIFVLRKTYIHYKRYYDLLDDEDPLQENEDTYNIVVNNREDH